MGKFMNFLYERLRPLVEARWFEVVMSLIIFANPLAIFPQLIAVFRAPSVEGIAVGMWCIFAAIQTAFVFHGIKSRSASVFFSMLVSLLETLTIITVVYLRE